MKLRYLRLALFLFLSSATVQMALACTDVTIRAQNHAVVVARTMEFGPNLNSSIITSPRDRLFKTHDKDGQPTLSWRSKYGYIYFNGFNIPIAVDGLNEKGLSFGYLYLPGYTKYPVVKKGDENKALPYLYLGDWVLSNFSNVEQVRKALKQITVYGKAITVEGHANVVFPLHAIITDAQGNSIVVEFNNGKMQVYTNKLGVLTNSPTYDWQLTNLKNYVNLSPYVPNPIKVDGYVYSGTGMGSGSIGLPGDASPPSRFVKMAFLKKTAFSVKNAAEALILAQHIINNVDLPKGFVRGEKDKQSESGYTQWTVFKDLKHRIIYFKSYENSNLRRIDLNKINLSANAKIKEMPVFSKQVFMDVTKKLQ